VISPAHGRHAARAFWCGRSAGAGEREAQRGPGPVKLQLGQSEARGAAGRIRERASSGAAAH